MHNDPDCPHPLRPEETEFAPKPMVDWLAPTQLAATGIKTVTATTFGAYADKREMQAALASIPQPGAADIEGDYSGQEELWFDYIADLGDGFDATYTMARLLASPVLDLPQGDFVILGGDQVYPTASRDEYQNRFLGPYRAAFPWSPTPRDLYALPGNHDWYDGLRSFLRIFCQSVDVPGKRGRWIGAWRTRQRRSYFALRLPHDWWIWGIDSQLRSDLDRPQVDYFSDLAEEMLRGEGDPARHKIILVTAEPNWVFCGVGTDEEEITRAPVKPDDFDTLMWFENRLIRKNGFSLPLVLAGDLHHYVRYTSADGATHRITSGGGGAYLVGTHQMPAAIELPEGTTETTVEQMKKRAYKRAACYPSREASEAMTTSVLGLPRRNKSFAAFLSVLYLLFAWSAYGRSPVAILLVLFFILGCHGYTLMGATRQRLRGWEGWMHGGLHVVLAIVAWAVAFEIPLHWYVTAGLVRIGIFIAGSVLAIAIGYFGGGWLFASFLLWMSRKNGGHTNEVFSSMFLAHFKNFLRMHIDRDGRLHVHAIGVDKVPNDWKFEPVAAQDCGRPWYVSDSIVSPAFIDPEFTQRGIPVHTLDHNRPAPATERSSK